MKPLSCFQFLLVDFCFINFMAVASLVKTRFEDFYTSIGISALEAHTLSGTFQQAKTRNSSLVKVACQTAQLALPESQVDTAPLNQTVVDENWSQAVVSEPYCIIRPADANAVSTSIKIIGFYSVKFAIRSGGHSPNPGFSSIGHEGVLLDMGGLNKISLSKDKAVASVGPGARWGAVTDVMDSNGVAVVGGRLPTIGVGGFMLCGGQHYTSGQYGLAADNVKSYEVVLSNGSIIDANFELNDDLFFALKGGGPNFGIVTQYNLHTKPISAIWFQAIAYSVAQSSQVFDAFVQWQTDPAFDIKANVGLVLTIDSITVFLFYAQPTQPPAVFAPFYAIKPAQDALDPTNSTFGSLSTLLNSIDPSTPARHDYRAATARIDAQFYKDVFAFWLEKAVAVHNTTGANQTFTIENISSNTAKQGRLNGGNPMNIPEENHSWWETLVAWEGKEHDHLVRSVSIDTTAHWNKLASKRGLNLSFVYMGHSSRDQNPLASYGTENVARLKDIALKYDPSNLFQELQKNGFLLSHI